MFVATQHSDNTDHSTTAPTLKILSFSPLPLTFPQFGTQHQHCAPACSNLLA